jgi:hypothetical protein
MLGGFSLATQALQLEAQGGAKTFRYWLLLEFLDNGLKVRQ